MSASNLQRAVLHRLDNLGVGVAARRLVRSIHPGWRRQQGEAAEAFEAFLDGVTPATQLNTGRHPREGTVLIVGYESPQLATYQTPIILGARLAGRNVAILLATRQCAAAEFYMRVGACEIIERERFLAALPMARAQELVADVRTQSELLAISHRGIPCGKFAVSTLMRRFRIGSVDPNDPVLREDLIQALASSIKSAEESHRIIAAVRPSLVCFYDRGYTPDGELFEAALAAGAQASTLNTAHRSGMIICKRYSNANKLSHFGKPSPKLWAQLQAMPWSDARWAELRGEIEGCYSSGLWYDEVGTQFGTRVTLRDDTIRALGIDPRKPTAVIFPHLFWDATFFWGTDLFNDYREWFVEAVRIAAANTSLNWIVKIHPANTVKNTRDGYDGEASEVAALREVAGVLPDHIKILEPSSSISTLAIFDVLDYCLTVRGTVGLEAALFGKQVLTAGTGRYDGYGFTIDSQTREEYLARLARLHELPRQSPSAIELARRYAYGLFMLRPLATNCMDFHYRHDATATLHTRLTLGGATDLAALPDVAALASWLGRPEEEDLVCAAPPSEAPKDSRFLSNAASPTCAG